MCQVSYIWIGSSGLKVKMEKKTIRFYANILFTRKIKITVNRRFDVSHILTIEVVYANVKVVKRELKILGKKCIKMPTKLDAIVNENATKQQYHSLKKEK